MSWVLRNVKALWAEQEGTVHSSTGALFLSCVGSVSSRLQVSSA